MAISEQVPIESFVKECYRINLPVIVKNTFFDMQDSNLATDPRRSTSEPPRCRHHNRADFSKSPFRKDTLRDVSSTACGSPSASSMHDSESAEGSCQSSESEDTCSMNPNAPAWILAMSTHQTQPIPVFTKFEMSPPPQRSSPQRLNPNAAPWVPAGFGLAHS